MAFKAALFLLATLLLVTRKASSNNEEEYQLEKGTYPKTPLQAPTPAKVSVTPPKTTPSPPPWLKELKVSNLGSSPLDVDVTINVFAIWVQVTYPKTPLEAATPTKVSVTPPKSTQPSPVYPPKTTPPPPVYPPKTTPPSPVYPSKPPLSPPKTAPVPPKVPSPAPPPMPIVRTRKDCIPLCAARCTAHSRKNVCARACITCCDRCKCVPPGTYGNREMCGKCYTGMTTRGNRLKCP